MCDGVLRRLGVEGFLSFGSRVAFGVRPGGKAGLGSRGTGPFGNTTILGSTTVFNTGSDKGDGFVGTVRLTGSLILRNAGRSRPVSCRPFELSGTAGGTSAAVIFRVLYGRGGCRCNFDCGSREVSGR